MAWVESPACHSCLKLGPGDARGSLGWTQGWGRFLSVQIWKGQTKSEVPTNMQSTWDYLPLLRNKSSSWRIQIKATRKIYGSGTQMAEKIHPSSSQVSHQSKLSRQDIKKHLKYSFLFFFHSLVWSCPHSLPLYNLSPAQCCISKLQGSSQRFWQQVSIFCAGAQGSSATSQEKYFPPLTISHPHPSYGCKSVLHKTHTIIKQRKEEGIIPE